jgi:16S rRNA (cytidine1402-2'-O)-methyltransferase
MTSYHKFNRIEKTHILIAKMLEGNKVALVSDAGMPGISDPGEELVLAAYEAGIKVTVLPGATALTTAVVLSRLPTGRFSFEGFLPTGKKERDGILEQLKITTKPTVFYEAPHRLLKTLQMLSHAVGGDRKISVCRELTKKYEEVLMFSLTEAMEYYKKNAPRGEFVLVLDGRSQKDIHKENMAKWMELSEEQHVNYYVKQGFTKKEAIKMVAADRGVSKREIYRKVSVHTILL